MRLLKIGRRLTTTAHYVNEDAIDAVYEEDDVRSKQQKYYVLLRSGILYDIDEKTYRWILTPDLPKEK